MLEYPWYASVSDDTLEQGDLFEDCPVFLPPDDWADEWATESSPVDFQIVRRDLIVLSQSCDMVQGREKVSEVLLCPVWFRSEVTTGYLATSKGLEDARRGNLPGYHLLAPSQLAGFERELRIVDFRRVHSLPLGFIRSRSEQSGSRLRLLPPYREHLAQAFARFFMRVGLPIAIPPFR